MFDVSFSELLLIALVALVVLGPQRLPEVARGAGRLLGRLRGFVANVKQDLDRELHIHELSELRRLKEELEETKRTFEESSHRMLGSLGQTEPATAVVPTPLPSPSPSPESGVTRQVRRKKSHGQAKKKKRKARR
ncbi:MAG: Sec-independent protein translocase protein TatB [Pseudomonadota bacterium]